MASLPHPSRSSIPRPRIGQVRPHGAAYYSRRCSNSPSMFAAHATYAWHPAPSSRLLLRVCIFEFYWKDRGSSPSYVAHLHRIMLYDHRVLECRVTLHGNISPPKRDFSPNYNLWLLILHRAQPSSNTISSLLHNRPPSNNCPSNNPSNNLRVHPKYLFKKNSCPKCAHPFLSGRELCWPASAEPVSQLIPDTPGRKIARPPFSQFREWLS